jgi:hypothetical protein
MAAGIAGPIVLELLMRPLPWFSRIVLGQASPRLGGATHVAA